MALVRRRAKNGPNLRGIPAFLKTRGFYGEAVYLRIVETAQSILYGLRSQASLLCHISQFERRIGVVFT
jgi:hypothetical protein